MVITYLRYKISSKFLDIYVVGQIIVLAVHWVAYNLAQIAIVIFREKLSTSINFLLSFLNYESIKVIHSWFMNY